jgi:hypothetical protein
MVSLVLTLVLPRRTNRSSPKRVARCPILPERTRIVCPVVRFGVQLRVQLKGACLVAPDAGKNVSKWGKEIQIFVHLYLEAWREVAAAVDEKRIGWCFGKSVSVFAGSIFGKKIHKVVAGGGGDMSRLVVCVKTEVMLALEIFLFQYVFQFVVQDVFEFVLVFFLVQLVIVVNQPIVILVLVVVAVLVMVLPVWFAVVFKGLLDFGVGIIHHLLDLVILLDLVVLLSLVLGIFHLPLGVWRWRWRG